MSDTVDAFIDRWKPSSGSEMANFQTFANELTDLLAVERPKPATSDGGNNDYRFERPVTFTHTGRNSRGRIDLYKHGCFILEAKQGGDRTSKEDQDQLKSLLEKDAPKAKLGHGPRGTAKWDDTMLKARNQADGYARAVSKEDGWPPFLIIVDVGHVFELYADFSRAGQGYTQFPDGNRYRITLEDLRKKETRNLLRTIWTEPQSLDPSLVAAKVTREIATHLAELGKSFEEQGHDSETVARFLMRCLFSMFAEDVELIPKHSFTNKLIELHGHPEHAAPTLKALWETMNTGGFSTVLTTDLKRFNGGLFKQADALPLNNLQLDLLIEAAEADWKQVEPAIFGTLLERALDKRQRHKLGAHYTPRSYVERLVTPTIMEPLRADWKDVQTAVQRLMTDGKEANARAAVHEFHRKLCGTKVLDPACGSGNFLYVALEMMKRLEGEVTALLTELGENQASLGLSGHTVDPRQFLGIELNPWAANVAELVLWIGYLQWHFRTHGTAAPSEPVLKDFKNIENRDAVLEWSDRTPRLDEQGQPVTRWDGVTTMRHTVTGEEVPDPDARIQIYDYAKPKATTWPKATFIIGNPPFISSRELRAELGDDYVEGLFSAMSELPKNIDFVMYFWVKALESNANGVGLVATSRLRLSQNNAAFARIIAKTKRTINFAVPDHRWSVDGKDASVRICMAVAAKKPRKIKVILLAPDHDQTASSTIPEESYNSKIKRIETDHITNSLQSGQPHHFLTPLHANSALGSAGLKPYSQGFFVEGDSIEAHALRPYANGAMIGQRRAFKNIIDVNHLSEEEFRRNFPKAFSWVIDRVKPRRDHERNPRLRTEYWKYEANRDGLRSAIRQLNFYFATLENSPRRYFVALAGNVLPDQKLRVVAHDDWAVFAILNSRAHEIFSIAKGGRTGQANTPVYNSRCFDLFPFPDLVEIGGAQLNTLRNEGLHLNDFREQCLSNNPELGLTDLYNLLELYRATSLKKTTPADEVREKFARYQIGVLFEITNRIDQYVFESYGWFDEFKDIVGMPGPTSERMVREGVTETLEAKIIVQLDNLNIARATEEAAGHIRWLRPDFQNPEGKQAESKNKQIELEVGSAVKFAKEPWPKALPEQIAAVREALQDLGEASPEQIARCFQRARTTAIEPLLASLAALGQAEKTEDGRYAA